MEGREGIKFPGRETHAGPRVAYSAYNLSIPAVRGTEGSTR